MSFQVRIAGPAQRYLARLPRQAQDRILARIDQIADDPYGPYTKPLRGVGGLRAARVGGWRIVFDVVQAARQVDIADIGPRGQVYRRL